MTILQPLLTLLCGCQLPEIRTKVLEWQDEVWKKSYLTATRTVVAFQKVLFSVLVEKQV